MSAKFKVGDRVNVLPEHDGDRQIGPGTVVAADHYVEVTLDVNPDPGLRCFSLPKFVELLSAPATATQTLIAEECDAPAATATSRQVGGSHYKDLRIQPVDFIHQNGIGFLAGNVIKYVVRYKAKNGLQDLEKARHYIDMLIEAEKAGE